MESPGSTLANVKEQFLLCVKGNAREELYAGDDDETIKVELQMQPRVGGDWEKVA